MSTKMIGYGLIIVGAVVALVSVFADVIGIGNHNGFGWQQTLGTIVGVIVVLVGIWLVARKPIQKKQP